jgi:hypothetical protein
MVTLNGVHIFRKGEGVLENWTLMKIFGPKIDEVLIPVPARGLRQLACWGCGFEPRRCHECFLSSECCEVRGICEGLNIHPGESYRLSYVFSLIVETQQWGDSGPLGAVAPWGAGRKEVAGDPKKMFKEHIQNLYLHYKLNIVRVIKWGEV